MDQASIELQLQDTRFCPQKINSYIGNLTSSYTDKSNEPSMVAASVIMFVLAGLFFNLNLFSGISDISAILDPKVRLFLTSALSLFLPVMSYLFSEAKNAGYSMSASHTHLAGLSLRAGLILAWMLLVELLRKKVDEIRMRGFSGTIQRAGRVVWLGSLVFFNIESAGRKAVFSVLWILCATKVLQRIAFTEVGKNSYAHGKNARLISSYMSQMLEQEHEAAAAAAAATAGHHHHHQQQQQHNKVGSELLKTCNYIVMGEAKLVDIVPTADGYKLEKTSSSAASQQQMMSTTTSTSTVIEFVKQNEDSIITVGKVWGLPVEDKFFSSPEQTQALKRICLSFALFKLLRRRFEHLPVITEEEARNSRDLILKGLYNNGETTSAEAMFQVMNDEINFLSEYYHSVVPVVHASPFFLFINYFALNIVVAALCFMAVILCGNGDVPYAFQSIGADNYTLQSGVANIVICLLQRAPRSPPAFFAVVDLSITLLLFIVFFYEEIWEFLVFLLSNWFMVSLLYNYTAKPSWLKKTTLRGALFSNGFSVIMWLRRKIRRPGLSFRQFSVLNVRWPPKLPLFPSFTSLVVKKELVPNSVKKSIMDYLVQLDRATPDYNLDCGRSALLRNGLFHQFGWACDSHSVAEIILTWHIATSILEVERRPQSSTVEEEASSRVAIKLSKYCAYLVAFHPELIPENPEKVELVFGNIKEELKEMFGCRKYYLSWQRTKVHDIIERKAKLGHIVIENQAGTARTSSQSKVAREGIKLGRLLMGEPRMWKVLEDVWTELIIYLAPSSDEERVRGHEDVLAQGGEFITVLWALTTHIGVSRPPTKKTAAAAATPSPSHGDIEEAAGC